MTTAYKADGRSNQAKKFLRDYRDAAKEPEIKQSYTDLIELIDKGTYTILPNEIRRLKLRVDKEKMPYRQVENLVLRLAAKYVTVVNADGDESTNSELSANIEPEIILSETFIS